MKNPLFDALLAPHKNNSDTFIKTDTGQNLAYKEFVSRVATFATVISELGMSPGDRIALQVSKSVDALALCMASIQCGTVFLPLNPAYTAPEVAYFIQDSGAKLLVCPDNRQNELIEIAQGSGAELKTLNSDGTGRLAELADFAQPRPSVTPRSPNDLAALLYTSGTTGRSKGAMLTHENLLSNALTLADHWQFTKEDVLLHALPIFHTHGLFVATNTTLLTGGSMRFYEKFQTTDIVRDMPNATAMMGVPTFYTRLLDDPEFTKDAARNMRLFISGSAPMLAETHAQFTARTGHHILERYGMTETNMSTSNPFNGVRKPGTVGMPLPGVELKITDPSSGDPIPQGQIGQIEVRGPNVFQGYWNMPEKTAEELREDGFFITGDLASMDEDGYVTIVGREKDLIISGGFNVYPKEIEEAIDDHPDVLESAVIGIPHPDLGEATVAIVVPQTGVDLDSEDLFARLGSRLARFKQPREMIIVKQLPRNTMGKVQKAQMRSNYSNLFKP